MNGLRIRQAFSLCEPGDADEETLKIWSSEGGDKS